MTSTSFQFLVNKAFNEANIDLHYAKSQMNLHELEDNEVIVYFNVPFDNKQEFKNIVNGKWSVREKKWCKKCSANFLFEKQMMRYASLFDIHSIYDENNILREENGYSTINEVMEGLTSYFDKGNLDKYLKKQQEKKERYYQKLNKDI